MIIGLLYSYMLYTDWILTLIITILFVIMAFLYKKLLNRKLILMGEDRIIAVSSYVNFIKSTFSNYKFRWKLY